MYCVPETLYLAILPWREAHFGTRISYQVQCRNSATISTYPLVRFKTRVVVALTDDAFLTKVVALCVKLSFISTAIRNTIEMMLIFGGS